MYLVQTKRPCCTPNSHVQNIHSTNTNNCSSSKLQGAISSHKQITYPLCSLQTSSGVGSDLQASSLFPMSPLLTSHQLSMGSGDTAKDSGITATMAQLGPSVQGGSSIPLIGSSPSVSSGVSTTEDILNMPSVLGQNNF
jgi:hypothetical protein